MPKGVGGGLRLSQGLWRHGGAGGLAVLLATLTATLATAQPVAVIVGPTESQPGNLVVLRTTGTTGSGHVWLVLPAPSAVNFLPVIDSTGQQAAVFASGTPGTYTFVLAVAQGDLAAMTTHELVILGDVPNPPDPPDPADPPGNATAVVVVYDEGSVRPEQAEVIAQLRTHFDNLQGVDMFAVDVDDKDENGNRVAEKYIAAAGVDPPCVVIYTKDGIKWRGELPATSAELIAHADEASDRRAKADGVAPAER